MRYGKLPSAVIRERLRQSKEECKELTRRELRCPHCGFLMDYVYSDMQGHLESKCQNCKRISIMNMAYFRTVKRKYYPTYQRVTTPIR